MPVFVIFSMSEGVGVGVGMCYSLCIGIFAYINEDLLKIWGFKLQLHWQLELSQNSEAGAELYLQRCLGRSARSATQCGIYQF